MSRGRSAPASTPTWSPVRQPAIAVDPAAAADAASAYLAASDVTGTVTITGGGTILEVVTSDTYDPRFLGALGVGPLTVGGHAQARLVRVMDGSEQ